ncbi:MAG: hypothetical protein VW518_00020 [Burkholderiaceae bacterium]
MAATFSSAVSATAPAIVDTNASQDTGAATQGIGLVPADEASISGSRIGGAPGTDLKGETGDGVGV